jgi:hypothetical protein
VEALQSACFTLVGSGVSCRVERLVLIVENDAPLDGGELLT